MPFAGPPSRSRRRLRQLPDGQADEQASALTRRAHDLQSPVHGRNPVRQARRPDPREGSAPPTPSSATSITSSPSGRSALMITALAFEYLPTLASASDTTKYAVASTAG